MMGYAKLAGLIGILLLIGAIAIQTARLKASQAEVVAAHQENAALQDRIRVQNDAVSHLKADSDAKMADASKSLQNARSEALKAEGESARLRLAASKARQPEQPRPANCPLSGADRAVATIRQGL